MSKKRRGNSPRVDRRSLLKLGLAAGGAVFLMDNHGLRQVYGGDVQAGTPRSIFNPRRQAFKQPLFVPEVLMPTDLSPAPGGAVGRPSRPRGRFRDVAHGIAPEFDGRNGAVNCADWNRFTSQSPAPTHHREYRLITEETFQEIVPGVQTPVFTYRDANNARGSGRTPGPTIVSRFRGPIVIRNENHLTRDLTTVQHDVETSIHQHGGHLPAHADGYPDFYTLAGEARDYFYPNAAPRRDGNGGCGDPFDETWIPSTMWYHDHAMDITGFNVSRGLAGFYLVVDDREAQLAEDNALPEIGGPFDIGLALTDQRFNADGTLVYDFLDHNGRLGDVFTVNGVAQPFFRVQRRKYRFRILNASNARVYQLRLSTRQPFLIFGADSWLFPIAGVVDTFEVSSGQRHDVIVDFRNAPDEVFLENIMIQTNGRKGDEVDPSRPTPLLKFIVEGSPVPNDATIDVGTTIRGFANAGGQWAPIRDNEAVGERRFKFDRSFGAFTVNNRFFNPRRADAVPELGTTERWIFENSSGGWWHPIHSHLEGFQIRTLDGKRPKFERSFNSDLVNLHGGEDAEVLIKFRTFTGPFAFHCHNVEHEDMRMMGTHDPRPAGEESPLDEVTRIDPNVSGVVPDCIELEEEKRIFFDVAGDVDRVAGRGVGFPECEFEVDDSGSVSGGSGSRPRDLGDVDD